MKVFKYPLPVQSECTIEMPRGARVLAVQPQQGRACIWALVDPDMELEKRRFIVAGTGHELGDWAATHRHVGTFQLKEGELVFHLFEIAPYAPTRWNTVP